MDTGNYDAAPQLVPRPGSTTETVAEFQAEVGTSQGPTQMEPDQKWRSRPGAARAVRISAFLFPIVLSVVFAFVLIRILPAPSSPGQTAGWWATLGIAVVLFAVASERAFRRLMPVAGLLEMALAFPGSAPSRYGAALRSRSVRDLQRSLEDQTEDLSQTPAEAAALLLEMANALSNHDRATRGHTERVRGLAVLIGQEMGLEPDEVEKLRWSALVHDVGKLRVRAEILNSTARPSDSEWNELTRHPLYGAELVEPLRPWLGDWVDAAGQHHEKWDGSGYPYGLKRDEISLSARIVAVADAYDVMTSIRSYKRSHSPAEARAELVRCSGQQFDPAVVKALLNVSVPATRFGWFAGWIAQVPIIGASWPNSGIMISSTASAILVAIGLFPGGFEPELIAYGAELVAEEDTDLAFAVNAPGTDLPDTVEIIKVVGPATARWDGKEIIVMAEPNATGVVTVTYKACWPNDQCLTSDATATFTAVNDNPEAEDDEKTATGPGPIIIRPLLNDSDVDADVLRISSAAVTAGEAGVEVDGDALVVTPDNEEPQTIGLSYVVVDNFGGSDTGFARVVVPDFNEGPTATDDVATVPATDTVLAAVLANDSDPTDDVLTITGAQIVGGAELGSVEIEGENLVFVAGEKAGTARVAYEISDGRRTARAVLTVTITPPPPITAADRLVIREDGSGSINVLANDLAPQSVLDPSTLRIVSTSLGTATHSGGGLVRFVGDPDAYGLGSVTYEVCNEFGLCADGYVAVEITRVNDAPTFSPGPDVSAGSGEQYAAQWATAISVGEANEPQQVVSFNVTTENSNLFELLPSVDGEGVLRFQGSAQSGTTSVTVSATDGLSPSVSATFTITIN